MCMFVYVCLVETGVSRFSHLSNGDTNESIVTKQETTSYIDGTGSLKLITLPKRRLAVGLTHC